MDIENGTQDLLIHCLETLPNIDINIKCGNSLVSYFDTTQDLKHYPNIKDKINEYKQAVENYVSGNYVNKEAISKKIKELHETFKKFCFKDKFKSQIQAFEKECDKYSQKYGDYLAKDDKNLAKHVKSGFDFFDFDESEAQKDFIKLQDSYNALFNLESSKPFEWRFEFPRILSDGDFIGFDIIIGNPPYIRQEEIKELKPYLQKAFYIYKGTSDIYTYFYELGYKILRNNGILSFITSNKWTRASYGENLREFILQNTQILNYIDFNGVKVFDSASVDTSITSLKKAKVDSNTTFTSYSFKSFDKTKDMESNNPIKDSVPQHLCKASEAFPPNMKTYALKQKIEKIGTPLKDWDISIYRGILTGYNEAFIIDSNKRDEILKSCDESEASLDSNGLSERERTSELIKPILRGRDIKRYSYEWAGLWIINTHNGYTDSNGNKIQPIEINQYPTLKAYFDEVANSNKGKGKGFYNRDDKGITAYNLRNCAYLEEFAKPKIVYSEIVKEPQFYLDNGDFKFGYFCAEATSFILTGKEDFKQSLEYLLGILHSKLATFAFKEFYAGGGLGKNGYRYKKAFLERLPIPKIDSKQEHELVKVVSEIIETKKINKDTKELESHLDSIVCDLYGLNDDEIKIIESKIPCYLS